MKRRALRVTGQEARTQRSVDVVCISVTYVEIERRCFCACTGILDGREASHVLLLGNTASVASAWFDDDD